MAQDIAGAPFAPRQLTYREIDILHHMITGDPRAFLVPHCSRRYIIGVMGRKLARPGELDAYDYTPATKMQVYKLALDLAAAGYLDTAGYRKYAYFTQDQRARAVAAVEDAGRFDFHGDGPADAQNYLGRQLWGRQAGLLRNLLRFAGSGRRHRPYDISIGRGSTAAVSKRAVREADTDLAHEADRQLHDLVVSKLISRDVGPINHYYMTEDQFRLMTHAFHRGALGFPDISGEIVMDVSGTVLAVGVPVRVLPTLVDGDQTPISYPTGRPSDLVGRIAKHVGDYKGIRWFLVDFGNQLKACYSNRELEVVPPQLPAAPDSPSVTLDALGHPWLVWEGPVGCTFRVERRAAKKISAWKTLGNVAVKSYSDRSPVVGALNVYRVSSVNNEGASGPCPEVSIQVPEKQKKAAAPGAVAPSTTGTDQVRTIWPRQRIVDTD